MNDKQEEREKRKKITITHRRPVLHDSRRRPGGGLAPAPRRRRPGAVRPRQDQAQRRAQGLPRREGHRPEGRRRLRHRAPERPGRLMTGGPSPTDGVARFIADLEEEGHKPTRCGDAVRYTVVPAAGRYAGQEVETGVSVSELQGWPTVPPHWIHLPDEVNFTHTNTDTPTARPAGGATPAKPARGRMTRKPILIWISHVRGMLGQAI